MSEINSFEYYFKRNVAYRNNELRCYDLLFLLQHTELKDELDINSLIALVANRKWSELVDLNSLNNQKDNLWIGGVTIPNNRYYVIAIIDYYEPFKFEQIVYKEELTSSEFNEIPFKEVINRQIGVFEQFYNNLMSLVTKWLR